MRINYQSTTPQAFQGMLAVDGAVRDSSLEPELVELVKLRASQINGCAFCLDMHSKDARALGEQEQRFHLLAAWREAPGYSDRERAALAWCEALTQLPGSGAPDSVFDPLTELFSDEEIVALTYQIVAINGWNRLAVGLRSPVGDYVSPYGDSSA